MFFTSSLIPVINSIMETGALALLIIVRIVTPRGVILYIWDRTKELRPLVTNKLDVQHSLSQCNIFEKCD